MAESHWEFTSSGVLVKAGAWKDDADRLHPFVQPTLDGVPVSETNPLPVKHREDGVWDCATGNAPGTVDVPTDARILSVHVLAGSSDEATVTILGKPAITIPANVPWNEDIKGLAVGGAETNEVVFAGAVAFFFVSWVEGS